MYHEVWRIERDFFYDPGVHGLDLKAAEKKYAPYLEGVASRADLNYLFEEMLGELTCGHVYVGGGDLPEVKGRRRPARAPTTRSRTAATASPGSTTARTGTRELRAPADPAGRQRQGRRVPARGQRPRPHGGRGGLQAFEATAGKQTVIKVGPTADGKGAREVTVVPVDSESGLRNLAWIEDNRRKVDELSGGRLAYVYLPDTAERRLLEFQPLLLRPGRQGGRHRRRALQRRRPHRRLHHRLPAAAAHGLLRRARRRRLHHARRLDLRAEGDDHQRIRRLGRRRDALDLPGGRGRAARREADLGRPRRHRRGGALDGRRLHGRAAERLLESRRDWDVENHGVAPDIEVEMDPASVRRGAIRSSRRPWRSCSSSWPRTRRRSTRSRPTRTIRRNRAAIRSAVEEEPVDAVAGGQEELQVEGVVVEVDRRRAGQAEEALLDLAGLAARPRPVLGTVGLPESVPLLARSGREVVQADEGLARRVEPDPILA